MDAIPHIAAAVVGYLLGSLPFGWFVARCNGVNIFEVGSRNPGATNVKRCVGKGAGNLVFALDCLKGVVATLWIRWLPATAESAPAADPVVLGLIGFAAAMLGHVFPLFTRFRGGKGVATMLGGTVALMPLAALVGAVVWLALFYGTRYVSVASMGLAVSLPVSVFFLHQVDARFWFASLLAAFVVYRHRENVARLVRGTENRFEKTRADGNGGSAR
ncbi:glycerol-3-phosphate 1-O-acyltransferase PlsY [Opitutales bacterium ASA1]|uniref:glycerol-3-phosphate 1-O-acyltransferase PlsY n=1 Tax=Congregicoccus parvus TaxID=3081749 RepID=UPI002B2DC655|nr:glycerol-3-phosphate 1-O-acyltransferase PlsY [Opitutales bacterium ASA1]